MKILNWIGRISEEYSDTMALFLVVGGSISVAVSIGTLSGGGSFAGHPIIYLKHPITLYIGLVGIVFGFITQLSENLREAHKLRGKKIFVSLTILFIYLILYVFFS